MFPLRVKILREKPEFEVRVRNLGDLRGRPAELVVLLKPQHEADCTAGLPREMHTFALTGVLAAQLSGTKGNIWKIVERCHRALAEYYRQRELEEPSDPLLIEAKRPKGYRLDPDCRFVGAR